MEEVKFRAKDIVTENAGANSGAMVGVNSGSITVVNGMQYPEVRALCFDLIADEIKRYRAIALEEAKRREEQLFIKFAEKLSKEDLSEECVKKAFEAPEMQIECQEAQKAFIKAGTPELEDMLSDILVRRVKETDRTLLQITLGEAIKVATMLLPSQMATLALHFILAHTRRLDITNVMDFIHYCVTTVIPIYRNASSKHSEFQHLSFTGCAQISIGSKHLQEILSKTYWGLFSKGFTEADIPEVSPAVSLKDKYPSMFIPCITDNSKWQIGIMDEELLQQLFTKYNIEITDQPLLTNLFNIQHMSASEAKNQVVTWVAEMDDVFSYWEQSDIKSLVLSSVGIVIGAFYAQSKTSNKFNLNIWIE